VGLAERICNYFSKDRVIVRLEIREKVVSVFDDLKVRFRGRRRIMSTSAGIEK
jgi:hypothetical protein